MTVVVAMVIVTMAMHVIMAMAVHTTSMLGRRCFCEKKKNQKKPRESCVSCFSVRIKPHKKRRDSRRIRCTL